MALLIPNYVMYSVYSFMIVIFQYTLNELLYCVIHCVMPNDLSCMSWYYENEPTN